MNISETIQFIAESRPNPKHEIEQYFMKPESLKKQLSLCEALNGKKVLFLGDGDHLSLVLAKYLDIEATVPDIDYEIIESQSIIVRKIGLRNHSILHYDD
jgi:predicted methyltransferase